MRASDAILVALLATSCGGEPPVSALPSAPDAPDGGDAVVCDLGTGFPDRDVIDPDDPVYSDDHWTQEAVRAAFVDARANDTRAYRAYVAARTYTDLLFCGFCPCGCNERSGHLSAVDCFKDMHGFT